MLGVNSTAIAEIAAMKTPHSPAVRLLELKDPTIADRAMDLAEEWITQTMAREYPQSGRAERMVREIWLHLLEAPAIREWARLHPLQGGGLPAPETPEEAVEIAAEEVMYAEAQERQAALAMLRRLESGELKMPIVQLIMQAMG